MSESYQERHLVIVRHGQSEGDARRAAWRRGQIFESTKHPKDETQTAVGHKQSKLAGAWIGRHILHSSIDAFDVCFSSPMIRTRQSAESLNISTNWQTSELLAERNRGWVAGLTRAQHQLLFAESYKNMTKHPFYWVPPGGESILCVADRAKRFLDRINQYRNVLVVTHRDWIWAACLPLEQLSLEEMQSVDTGACRNGQVIEYTNLNPYSKTVDGDQLVWRRSVCPWAESQITTPEWIMLKLEGQSMVDLSAKLNE